MKFHEEAFEGTVEIVSAAMEEAEVELSEKGGEQVADFFEAIYRRLAAIEDGAEEEKIKKLGSFEVYQDAQGEYRFRVKTADNQIIVPSKE